MVGANIGSHDPFWVASGFAVSAFEPDTTLTSHLGASALLSEMRGVSVDSVAVEAKHGSRRESIHVLPARVGV